MGTLRGFDEFVNMVLDDVVEYEYTPAGRKEVRRRRMKKPSDHCVANSRPLLSQTQLDQILLNGANVCLLVPGGAPA